MRSLVITHIFLRANIHLSLLDREAVQDSSRRSRSAPTVGFGSLPTTDPEGRRRTSPSGICDTLRVSKNAGKAHRP